MANEKKDQAEKAPEIGEDQIIVDRAEFEAMMRQNIDNAALIEQLVEKVDQLQTAQLAGVGVDPAIAARSNLKRRPVQFKRHYNRAATPSNIQEGAAIVPAYSAEAGDIVNLREDEYKRIMADFPDLLESNPNKWVEKPGFRYIPGQDSRGRARFERVDNPIPVETLQKIALDLG